MSPVPLLLLASLGTATGPSRSELLRSYVTSYTAARAENARALIPAWARKYNMNCSGCHYPAPPRLNATGMRFKWAGYRMPDEFNETASVDKVQNYLAVRGRFDYAYSKTEGGQASSQFAFEDGTIFYGGPMGQNYSAFFEFERAAENNVELVANIGAKWGKENSYGGFRAGQFHWFLREGLAGFDRPVGIRTPTPVGGTLTSAVPFVIGNDQLGVEAFYVRGNNRLSGEVLSGINAEGKGDEGDPDTKKDFVLIDQYLIDNAGSGVAAVAYYGSIDSLAGPAQTSHFWRLGVSANKIISNFEILGALVYGKDLDLPTPTFPTAQVKGIGYWISGQYMFPKSEFTVFGRYEFVDPNTDVSSNGNGRFVAGGVLPVNRPEYIRLALEYALDVPQTTGSPKRNSLIAQLMLNF